MLASRVPVRTGFCPTHCRRSYLWILTLFQSLISVTSALVGNVCIQDDYGDSCDYLLQAGGKYPVTRQNVLR